MGRITNALKLLAGTNDVAWSPPTDATVPPPVTPGSVEPPSDPTPAADAKVAVDDVRGLTAVSFHGPELHAPAIRPEGDIESDAAHEGHAAMGVGGGPAGYESPSELWPDDHDDSDLDSPGSEPRSSASGEYRGSTHPEGNTEFTTHDLSPVLFDSLDFSLQATRSLIGELQGDASLMAPWPATLGAVEFSTFISACSAAIDEGEVAPPIASSGGRAEPAELDDQPDRDRGLNSSHGDSDRSEIESTSDVGDDATEPVIQAVIELDEEPDLSFTEPSAELQGERWLGESRPLDEIVVEPLAPLHPADDFAIDSEEVASLEAADAADAADAPDTSDFLVQEGLDEEWLPATTAASDVVWRHADELNWDLPTKYGEPIPLPAVEPQSGSEGQPVELEPVGATEYERQLMAQLSEHATRGAAVALAESIRQTPPGGDSHVVLVLSPGPSPEVADTLAQLALLLARDEFARVLLVDANLATSTLTERFEAQREGLLEAVLDGEPWDELVRATATAGLHVLASGDIVTARGIQIQSEEIVRLRRLVSRWRGSYDYVLIDGGSVELPLTRDLVQQADATFLQISLGRTDELQATAAMQQLQLLGGQVRGCLVLDT